MSNSDYGKNLCESNQSCHQLECTKTYFQHANISLPVEIKPAAMVGEIEMECCGEPVLTNRACKDCNTCEVLITQQLCVKIPIVYKVSANISDCASIISCENPDCI